MSRAATVIILRYLMFVLSFSCHAEDILDNKPDDDDDIYIMMKCNHPLQVSFHGFLQLPIGFS